MAFESVDERGSFDSLMLIRLSSDFLQQVKSVSDGVGYQRSKLFGL
ncbi:hypothetical protein C942_00737 [Photobacterium marinum]|uniref:Uncharacterized protein n=1 Tax=Photobacterium marinum TaxID=1056511 RepID=L8JDQ6_9GAMM|nr:hypothetical protein C942_00737 [Photobacterium marinum]